MRWKMEVTLSKDSIDMLASAIAEKMSQAKHEKLVGIKDLAVLINTPVGTIYHWVNNAKQNKMPFSKKGVKLQFKISEVQKWMESK